MELDGLAPLASCVLPRKFIYKSWGQFFRKEDWRWWSRGPPPKKLLVSPVLRKPENIPVLRKYYEKRLIAWTLYDLGADVPRPDLFPFWEYPFHTIENSYVRLLDLSVQQVKKRYYRIRNKQRLRLLSKIKRKFSVREITVQIRKPRIAKVVEPVIAQPGYQPNPGVSRIKARISVSVKRKPGLTPVIQVFSTDEVLFPHDGYYPDMEYRDLKFVTRNLSDLKHQNLKSEWFPISLKRGKLYVASTSDSKDAEIISSMDFNGETTNYRIVWKEWVKYSDPVPKGRRFTLSLRYANSIKRF
jgi:hypothetical protein